METSGEENKRKLSKQEGKLCQMSGSHLKLMVPVCLQGGKWDLTTALGSNQYPYVCVLKPSEAQWLSLQSRLGSTELQGISAQARAYYGRLKPTLSMRQMLTSEIK